MAGYCTHCGGSGFRRPSREVQPVRKHRANLCCAITGYGHTAHIPWVQRCQQTGKHLVRGVLLCGTHFNALSRGDIETVVPMTQLQDDELLGEEP